MEALFIQQRLPRAGLYPGFLQELAVAFIPRRAVVLLACAACSKAPPATENPPPATSAAIISAEVRAVVCKKEPCGGDTSSINVYRDAGGNVKRLYRLYGACSHSPGIYFDPDGTQTDIIPERPIAPGSAEAKELEARHEKQIGGLKMTDVIRCQDGLRLPPR